MKNLNKLAAEVRNLKKQLARDEKGVIDAEQAHAEAVAKEKTTRAAYWAAYDAIMQEVNDSYLEEPEEEAVEVETEGEGGLSAEGVVVTEKPEMPEKLKAALAAIENKEAK